LGKAIKDNRSVEPWYRYNSLCFVKQDLIDTLPKDLQRRRVADADPVVDISPYAYKVRKKIIKKLPEWSLPLLAQSKKYSILLSRRLVGER
jgi:hypothetical protein